MRRPLLAALAALASGALFGCGDTFVDPFLRDGGSLSVFGVLESGFANQPAERQTIRVQPVRTRFEPPRSPDDPTLDYTATVTSVDTFTGDSLRWRPRRLQFADGTYGDLFTATFRPRPGGTYRVVVRRDDGRTATASVTLPDRAEVDRLPWRTDSGGRVVEGAAWPAFRLDDAQATVSGVCGLGCSFDIPVDAPDVRDLGDGRVAVELDLTRAALTARRVTAPPEGDDSPPPDILLRQVRISARILGPDWALAGDPTRTTVEDGYGFVGGATRVETTYEPTRAASQAAGFDNP